MCRSAFRWEQNARPFASTAGRQGSVRAWEPGRGTRPWSFRFSDLKIRREELPVRQFIWPQFGGDLGGHLLQLLGAESFDAGAESCERRITWLRGGRPEIDLHHDVADIGVRVIGHGELDGQHAGTFLVDAEP